jgi:transaldolase
MIKVPATEPGIAAIEELTAAGVNVNVTLLFDTDRYSDVIEAYLRGLEREGVQAFQDSYDQLLGCIEKRVRRLQIGA